MTIRDLRLKILGLLKDTQTSPDFWTHVCLHPATLGEIFASCFNNNNSFMPHEPWVLYGYNVIVDRSLMPGEVVLQVGRGPFASPPHQRTYPWGPNTPIGKQFEPIHVEKSPLRAIEWD